MIDYHTEQRKYWIMQLASNNKPHMAINPAGLFWTCYLVVVIVSIMVLI